MNLLKGIISVAGLLLLLVVLTVLFVYVRTEIELPGVKAIGLRLVTNWTIYSPIYWVLVIAAIGGYAVIARKLLRQ